MDTRLVFIALAMLVVVANAGNSRNLVKRQVGGNYYNCAQGAGSSFVDPNDCTQFMECGPDGTATHKECGLGTYYDTNLKRCEWLLDNLNPPNCQMPTGRGVKQMFLNLCDSNPNGNQSEAWHVPHPTWCNGLMTCSAGYMHEQCTFCAEGTYYLTV